MTRKSTLAGMLIVVLVLATIPLLGSDNVPFLRWWLMTVIIGLGFYPLTAVLFSEFEDRGWMFSKVFGIAVSGFAIFALASAEAIPFTAVSCIAAVVICCAVSWILGFWKVRIHAPNIDLILGEELLFLFFFLLWTYLAGFHPEAHGTEKFMDYGFVKALMRSTYLPAEDIWYSGAGINYYYGGQYYAVFLTKLSGTDVKQTYHLMRTLVAAFAFVLPFSISWHLAGARGVERIRSEGGKKRGLAPIFCGILSGLAVSVAGNMHYVIYGCILPWLGIKEEGEYWFPNSTRYIGYNPPVENDKTIHEFPSYSFVLGDLHAHVVNVFFVLFVIGLLYGFVKHVRKEPADEGHWSWKQVLLEPRLLAAGFFIGLFQFTNYWDFVIYFVVICSFSLYAALYRYHCRAKYVIPAVLFQAIEVFGAGFVTALPFNAKFETMVSGVALAENHSRGYQLLILWGLPVILVLLFMAAVVFAWKKEQVPVSEMAGPRVSVNGKSREEVEELAVTMMMGEELPEGETLASAPAGKRFRDFWREASYNDIVVGILGICAMGLVLIPELVYVRDIYEASYARSNTMFKLTYQAFIMFGICMGYIVVRFLLWKKDWILKALGGIGLFFLVWTFGYFGTAVYSWFGEVWNPGEYRGLDATAYLENVFPEDAAAIRYLDREAEGQCVVLEANGDSYSDYQRVSAMTGLPTVLGWYVHEWLWRSEPADLNVRSDDVMTIYTSTDKATVRELLEKYRVSYIFLGSKEEEKYGVDLNRELLTSLGEVVFSDETSGTEIVKLS